MAKKSEPKIIHPVTMLDSLRAYRDDANGLLIGARHALTFLEDKELDAARVIEVVTPILREAADKLARWNEAD